MINLDAQIELQAQALGAHVYGVEYQPQGSMTLVRVYIEHPEGVSVDLCADVARQIRYGLDPQTVDVSRILLEVSSPGLERPLWKPAHFESAVGSEVIMRLKPGALMTDQETPIKKLQGMLISADARQCVIETLAPQSLTYTLPYSSIMKAHVIFRLQKEARS